MNIRKMKTIINNNSHNKLRKQFWFQIFKEYSMMEVNSDLVNMKLKKLLKFFRFLQKDMQF